MKLFTFFAFLIASTAFADNTVLLNPGSSAEIEAGRRVRVSCEGTTQSSGGLECDLVFYNEQFFVKVDGVMDINKPYNSLSGATSRYAQLRSDHVCR